MAIWQEQKMTEIITKSTSANTMNISPFVLHETGTTRLSFYPRWVDGSENHLRGGFRYEKKSRNDEWKDIDGKSITTLHKDESYELNLSGDDMAMLFSNLEAIKVLLEKHGHQWGKTTFRLAENNINGVLLQIGNIENKELVINRLRELESTNFESLENVIAIARLTKVINEIKNNIANNSESYWQDLFEKYPWILQQVFAYPVYYIYGETHLGGKNTHGRQGQGGIATDFLFKDGSNGSFAVIEIKPPTKKIVGAVYRGNSLGDQNTSHSMSDELTGGLVQMENQIRVAIEDFRSMLGKDYPELNRLNPSGVLLIGRSATLTPDELRSFNLFRKSLGKNLVMTFDELPSKLELLRGIYE